MTETRHHEGYFFGRNVPTAVLVEHVEYFAIVLNGLNIHLEVLVLLCLIQVFLKN